MEKVITFVVGMVAIAALALGLYWLIWQLWCWVLPQLWAGGPEQFVQPSYWLFAAAWFLLSLVGRAIFGRRK